MSVKFRTRIIIKKGEYKSAVTPVFAVKYCCSVFLQINDSLGEFYTLLVVDQVCYRLVTVSLKHKIKKDMFSVLSKINLFRSGRGDVPPSPILATHLTITTISLTVYFGLTMNIEYE